MASTAIHVDLNEKERAQYDALLDRLDVTFAKIVEYLAAKSGCNNAASLSREARKRLLVEASSLTDAFDQVHTDENDPDDDGEGHSEWDLDGAEDKLANLHRDLLQLLARHHAEYDKCSRLIFRAAMRA
jgi:hypothetical protein